MSNQKLLAVLMLLLWIITAYCIFINRANACEDGIPLSEFQAEGKTLHTEYITNLGLVIELDTNGDNRADMTYLVYKEITIYGMTMCITPLTETEGS